MFILSLVMSINYTLRLGIFCYCMVSLTHPPPNRPFSRDVVKFRNLVAQNLQIQVAQTEKSSISSLTNILKYFSFVFFY